MRRPRRDRPTGTRSVRPVWRGQADSRSSGLSPRAASDLLTVTMQTRNWPGTIRILNAHMAPIEIPAWSQALSDWRFPIHGPLTGGSYPGDSRA